VTAGRGSRSRVHLRAGHALTYAGAGAVFVLLSSGPQAFFQQPDRRISLLFIALGSHVRHLRCNPSPLQTRLTNVRTSRSPALYRPHHGPVRHWWYTCVAPAIIGALSVISQTDNRPRAGRIYPPGWYGRSATARRCVRGLGLRELARGWIP